MAAGGAEGFKPSWSLSADLPKITFLIPSFEYIVLHF